MTLVVSKPIGICGSKDACLKQQPSTRKATAEIKLANKTTKPVVYKIKCNNPKIFTIFPSATGLLQAEQSRDVLITLQKGFQPEDPHKVLVQAIYINPDQITANITPEDLWAKQVVDDKFTCINAKMVVNVNSKMPDEEPAEATLAVVEQWIGSYSSRKPTPSQSRSSSKSKQIRRAVAGPMTKKRCPESPVSSMWMIPMWALFMIMLLVAAYVWFKRRA